MKTNPFKFALFWALMMMTVLAHAQNTIPSIAWIADPDNILGSAQRAAITGRAALLDNATQAVVPTVIVDSLKGESIEEFAGRIADEWHPGRDGDDRGAILVIAVKERKVRIHTSRAISGTLTDSRVNQIIDNLKPVLKAGDWAGAIQLFYDKVTPYVGLPPGQAEKAELEKQNGDEAVAKYFVFIVGGCVFFIIVGGLFLWWTSNKREEEFERGRRERYAEWLAQNEINELERRVRQAAAAKATAPKPVVSDRMNNPHYIAAGAMAAGSAALAAAPTPPVRPKVRHSEATLSGVKKTESRRSDDDDVNIFAAVATAAVVASAYSSRSRDDDSSSGGSYTPSAPDRTPDPPTSTSDNSSYDGGGGGDSF